MCRQTGIVLEKCPSRVAACLAALLAILPAFAGAELFAPRSRKIQDGAGTGVEGFALPHDNFGHALAVGDFDGDGRDDLAVGDRESLTAENEGSVHIFYSRFGPLSTDGDVVFKDFDPATGEPDREIGDAFGDVLVAGDFNGDGYDDLAIGIPSEDIGFYEDAGSVLVIYGSLLGLQPFLIVDAQRLKKGSEGIFDEPHDGDHYGHALAAGDFDADGMDDLAIGCPSCDAITFQQPADAGSVFVAHGTASGLVFEAADRYFTQDSGAPGGMLNRCELGDVFGASLAAGDFDGDGADDLAVGVPGETVIENEGAGAVHVIYGAVGVGLVIEGNQFWYESIILAGGANEAGDAFGQVLAAGDVTGDGIDDLAIGTPLEDVGALVDAGAVTLLWGQPGIGLDTPGSEIYHQGVLGDGESPAELEHFGAALAIGDFVEQNAIGSKDLAIGIPEEEVFDPVTLLSLFGAGSVTVVPGGFGLDATSAVLWTQGARGGAGGEDLDEHQRYGAALAAGDFDGDGHDDLAVGATWVDGFTSPGVPAFRSGAVYLYFGALFADGFETGNRSAWSGAVP